MKHLLTLLVIFSANAWAADTPTTPRQPDNVDQVTPPKSDDSKSLLVSGEVSVYSDDIFRGVSMSDHQPVVQGWLGLSYMQFLNAGVYTSST